MRLKQPITVAAVVVCTCVLLLPAGAAFQTADINLNQSLPVEQDLALSACEHARGQVVNQHAISRVPAGSQVMSVVSSPLTVPERARLHIVGSSVGRSLTSSFVGGPASTTFCPG